MAAIHLICGFIGFGKTTYAKQLERDLPAVRFTHDEIMLKRYGRVPNGFQEKYQLIDNYIKEEAAKLVKIGKNVILDYGFWSRETRAGYYQWAKNLTNDVYFHAVICDISLAKQRALERSKTDTDALYIDEACFETRLKRFEPLTEDEGYPVIFHYAD